LEELSQAERLPAGQTLLPRDTGFATRCRSVSGTAFRTSEFIYRDRAASISSDTGHCRSFADDLARETPHATGTVGDAVGQLRLNRDDTTAFKMQRRSTNWFHMLLTLDGKLLPGFAP
jgi:hypothetical protein